MSARARIERLLELELEPHVELVLAWAIWDVPVSALPADVSDALRELARSRVIPVEACFPRSSVYAAPGDGRSAARW